MLRMICILDGIIQLGTIALISVVFTEITKRVHKISKKQMCTMALVYCVIFHLLLIVAIDYTAIYPTHRYIILDILCVVVGIVIEWVFTRVIYNNLTDLISYVKGDKNE